MVFFTKHHVENLERLQTSSLFRWKNTSLHYQPTPGVEQPPSREGDASVVQSCYPPWHSSVSSARWKGKSKGVNSRGTLAVDEHIIITTAFACASFLAYSSICFKCVPRHGKWRTHHFCCNDVQWIYDVFLHHLFHVKTKQRHWPPQFSRWGCFKPMGSSRSPNIM